MFKKLKFYKIKKNFIFEIINLKIELYKILIINIIINIIFNKN